MCKSLRVYSTNVHCKSCGHDTSLSMCLHALMACELQNAYCVEEEVGLYAGNDCLCKHLQAENIHVHIVHRLVCKRSRACDLIFSSTAALVIKFGKSLVRANNIHCGVMYVHVYVRSGMQCICTHLVCVYI